ncbi:MAG: hypothetical protein HY332_01785 [Chloroflexi bacterium]|nr:hypothetical protein [Chloroflexota bacterium]
MWYGHSLVAGAGQAVNLQFHITFGLTPKGGDILEEVTPALNKIYNGGTNVKTELDGLTQRINAIFGVK